MTDKLTPGQLRDLADLCNVGNRVVTLHANGETTRFYPNKDLAHVLREEAARREAEARPTRQDDFQWCENCPTAEVCRIGGCNGGERIGPLTGIEAGPDAVHPKPPRDEPAPAADEMAASILALEHRDPCYPTPHPRCVTVAEFIRAQAREIAERDARLAMVTRERDRLHVECSGHMAENARLREALVLILPLAKGYARTYDYNSNREYVAIAEAALARGGDR